MTMDFRVAFEIGVHDLREDRLDDGGIGMLENQGDDRALIRGGYLETFPNEIGGRIEILPAPRLCENFLRANEFGNLNSQIEAF